MLEENSLIEADGMAKNSFQSYLIYIGLFLAGAILTPILLGMLNGDKNQGNKTGDRQDSGSEVMENGFTAPSATDQSTTSTFEPNDKQEDVLKDYETTSPAALKNLPTTLPQYALNQPSVKPYPNYWANTPQITFAPQPSSTKADPKASPAPSPKQEQTLPSGLSAASSSIPANVFTPPKEGEATTFETFDFNGSLKTFDSLNLKDFLNAPEPAPEPVTEPNKP